MRAAAGTSIIMPTSRGFIEWNTVSPQFGPACLHPVLAAPQFVEARDHRIHQPTLPWALARRMARSCVRKRSGWERLIRIARQPRKGFCSWARSPPEVCPRRDPWFDYHRRRRQALGDRPVGLELGFLVGRFRVFRKRNSVRNNPTPSAPHSTTSGDPMGPRCWRRASTGHRPGSRPVATSNRPAGLPARPGVPASGRTDTAWRPWD